MEQIQIQPITWDQFVDTLSEADVNAMLQEPEHVPELLLFDLSMDLQRKMRDAIYESKFNYDN